MNPALARMAHLITATWGDEQAFDTYMESLLTDKSGNRKGFPPDVLAELVALQRYRHTLQDENLAWNSVSKRG